MTERVAACPMWAWVTRCAVPPVAVPLPLVLLPSVLLPPVLLPSAAATRASATSRETATAGMSTVPGSMRVGRNDAGRGSWVDRNERGGARLLGFDGLVAPQTLTGAYEDDRVGGEGAGGVGGMGGSQPRATCTEWPPAPHHISLRPLPRLQVDQRRCADQRPGT